MTAIGFALFAQKPKLKNGAKYTALVLFLLFTNTGLFLKIAGKWEVPGTPFEAIDQRYEIGIVLTGMAEYNNDLRVLSMRRGADRIWQAVTLYKKGIIKKILITGKSGYVTERGLDEARQFKEVLTGWGIPSNDIIVETVSKNTHENALYTKKLLTISYPHVSKCLLITSGLHMKRAKACFEKEGILCDAFSTDLYSSPSGSASWDQWLIPSLSTLQSWQFFNKEWVGYISYKIAGYL